MVFICHVLCFLLYLEVLPGHVPLLFSFTCVSLSLIDFFRCWALNSPGLCWFRYHSVSVVHDQVPFWPLVLASGLGLNLQNPETSSWVRAS